MAQETRPPPVRRRILIVDAHPIVGHGLEALIEAEPTLTCCGTARSPSEVERTLETNLPDLVILDPGFDGGNGFDLLESLRNRRPELPILVLSKHEETYQADRALRAGAMGYVTKTDPVEQIITAIHQVLSGLAYLSEPMATAIFTQMVGRPAAAQVSLIDDLSPRETDVLGLLGKGLDARQIAEQLDISVKTVENHRTHLKDKLKLGSNAQLLRYAIQRELQGG